MKHTNHLWQTLCMVLALCLFAPVAAFAQITVSGNVYDAIGPVIGASVFEEGTSNGTVTDADGNFSLKVAEGTTLVFSSIGYKTIQLPASPSMKVMMEEDNEMLEETVIIGYGTTKAKNFTGSVDQVKMSDSPVADLNLASASDILRNRLSGVVMGAESGTVGSSPSILVRGQKSISSTTSEPLIVLNGVIFSGQLDDIDPTTIESISVLKDATSLAAYGSRAAQGVVMVTTKKGRDGKPKINFSTSHQLSTPTYRTKYLSGEKYIEYKNLKEGVSDLTNTAFMTPFELDNYAAGRTTDWYKLARRTGYTQNYNLNFSGAGERFNYFIGAGHSGQVGMTKGNQFKRNNLSMNVTTKVTTWLEVGANFNYTNTFDDSMAANLYGARLTPYGTPFFDDGSYVLYVDGQDATQQSPLWNLAGNAEQETTRNNLTLGGFASINIPWVEGLNFRINASWTNITNNKTAFYHESYYPSLLSNDYDGIGYTLEYCDLSQAYGYSSATNNKSWVIDNILSYARQFGQHYISASLVYTRDSATSTYQYYSGKDFSNAGNTILGWYGLGNAATQVISSPTYSLHTDVGYLARVMWSYRDTYHLNASFRRDGSSVFGKNHKWGNFPAFGAAWTITNEEFMKGRPSWLDRLKLKLSWGKNGAQTLSPYSTLSTVSMAQSGGIASYYDGFVHWGQKISALGNPELGWQTTTSWNGGFEADFLKRRLSMELNLYTSKTTDQIFSRNIPIMSSGITTQNATMGQVNNWGIELNANSVNIQKGDFMWTSNLVFTLNRNKLVELYGDGQDDITNSLFIGKPLGAIYGYTVSRINAETGTPIYIAADGSETENPSPEDRSILGYSKENFRLNLSNTLKWKNFSLYMVINGIFGGHGYALADNTFAYVTYNTGHSTSAFDIPYWTPTNKSTEYPSPAFANTGSYYAVYNSYGHVRLQDLGLTYNITPLVSKWGIDNAKVSVSGRNLFYIAPKWKLSDPESRSGFSISLPRAITFALNLTF